jgi:hypothetical protein
MDFIELNAGKNIEIYTDKTISGNKKSIKK